MAPTRANVGLVRHVLSGLADAGAVSRARMEKVLLAVSEAVTNVVRRHGVDGLAAGGAVEVEGTLVDGVLRVAVRDGGLPMLPRPDDSGMGQGLPIIAAVADRVTFHDAPGGGAEVVMEFALAGDG